MGQAEKLNISCNGHTRKHEFDMLELDDSIDVILGKDILPHIDVALTGVVVNWDDNKVIYDDSIDDSEYQPSISHAGAVEEHKALLAALQKYIDDNQKIDKKSFCTIPESIVCLPTPEGKVAFRK